MKLTILRILAMVATGLVFLVLPWSPLFIAATVTFMIIVAEFIKLIYKA